tara:strand:- start:51 stop:2300 length:2250 start_codon:yes stop_codon:yes gene_type:complete
METLEQKQAWLEANPRDEFLAQYPERADDYDDAIREVASLRNDAAGAPGLEAYEPMQYDQSNLPRRIAQGVADLGLGLGQSVLNIASNPFEDQNYKDGKAWLEANPRDEFLAQYPERADDYDDLKYRVDLVESDASPILNPIRGAMRWGADNLGFGAAAKQLNNYMDQREVDIDAQRRAQDAADGTNNADNINWGRGAGNIGGTLAAILATRKLPGRAPSVTPRPSSLSLRGSARNAVEGATGSLLAPVTGLEEGQSFADAKIDQAQAGGALGVIIPGAGRGGINIASALRNKFGDAANTMGRVIRDNVPESLRPGIAARLRNEPEVVYGPPAPVTNLDGTVTAGSMGVRGAPPRSVGEIAAQEGDTGLPSIQQMVDQRSDPTGTNLAKILRNEARVAEVDQYGNPARIKAADDARTEAVAPLTKDADASTAPINTQPIIDDIDALIDEASQQSSVRNMLTKLKKALRVDPEPAPAASPIYMPGAPTVPPPTPPNTILTYTQAKSALDEIKSQLAQKNNAGGNLYDDITVGRLTRIKDRLNKAIGLANPAAREARETFAEYSAPWNEAMVMGNLTNRLNPSLRDFGAEMDLKPAAVSDALRNPNKVLKEATGFGRGSDVIEDTLTPPTMESINRTIRDITSEGKFDKAVIAGTQKIMSIIKDVGDFKGLGVLERNIVVFNSLMSRLSKNTMRNMLDEIDVAFKPGSDSNRAMAEILENTPINEREIVREVIDAIAATMPRTAAPVAEAL